MIIIICIILGCLVLLAIYGIIEEGIDNTSSPCPCEPCRKQRQRERRERRRAEIGPEGRFEEDKRELMNYAAKRERARVARNTLAMKLMDELKKRT